MLSVVGVPDLRISNTALYVSRTSSIYRSRFIAAIGILREYMELKLDDQLALESECKFIQEYEVEIMNKVFIHEHNISR